MSCGIKNWARLVGPCVVMCVGLAWFTTTDAFAQTTAAPASSPGQDLSAAVTVSVAATSQCTPLQRALADNKWSAALGAADTLVAGDINVTCPLTVPQLRAVTERSLQLRSIPLTIRPAATSKAQGVGEFVTYSTLYGVATGFLLNSQFEVDDIRVFVGVPMATTALAFFGSLQLGKSWDYTAGQSASISSAVAWGMFHSIMLNQVLDQPETDMEVRILLGEVVGGLAGYGFAQTFPDRVTVVGANSGGAWGAIVGAFITLALSPDSEQVAFGVPMAFSLAGMAAGAKLGAQGRLTRQQWALVDVGGVVGTLAGLGIGAAGGSEDSVGLLAALGAGVGLSVGWLSMAGNPASSARSGHRGDRADDEGLAVRVYPTVLADVDPNAPGQPVMGAALVIDQW